LQSSPAWAKPAYLKKITYAKRTGGMVQVAEHLPGKYEALSSNSCTAKKIIKKEKYEST
jgi:hypothetical protein